MTVRPERVIDVRTSKIGPSMPTGVEGPTVYWMNRDKRVHQNWALLYARSMGNPVVVVLPLGEEQLGPSDRHIHFVLDALPELERDLEALNIPLFIVKGAPEEVVPTTVDKLNAGTLITDFEPLHHTTRARQSIAKNTSIPFHCVDAHNVVPTWIASNKLEYAAYTIRPKVVRNLSTYLEPFPELESQDGIQVESPFPPFMHSSHTTMMPSGIKAAEQQLSVFLDRFNSYEMRNDPTVEGQSDLSPYLHFGHISAQHVALRGLEALNKTAEDLSDIRDVGHGFFEELIVRKELSDNFTHFNPKYDSFEGLPDWARTTLDEHRADERDHLYSFDEWEAAETHDELWNAAQRQLISTGKMHGYMRMYWAKKILEWSATPEEAMATAQALNDHYSLDGSDPNGFVGVAWSIGGVHDRAWTERPVFGKIRYMNAAGCKRKFDVATYIRTYESL